MSDNNHSCSQGKNNTMDFANEPVRKLFRRMLVPTLVGMVSLVILNLTDGAFIGHGAGSESLAAINIAAPIFNILAAIGIMFGIGSSVIASVHLSRGRNAAADISITAALLGTVTLGIVTGVLILCNLETACRLFGSSDVLIPLAGDYLKWIALAEPLILIHIVGVFLIRLDGSPKFAMATSLVGTVLNIFLDWLFIFPFGWGLEGAAIATSISFSLAGLMVLYYFFFMSKALRLYRFPLSWKVLRVVFRNLAEQSKIGFSGMLGEVAICGTIITGNYIFIRYLGEDGVAAYSVACYCFPVIFMMANAIVQSAQPIVSFAFGADDRGRLIESQNMMLRWALAAGLIASAVMFVCAPLITMLFIDETEHAYDLCIAGLPYFGIGVVFITLNIVMIGYMQSIEQSARATLYTLLRGFIIIIPCFIFLPRIVGDLGMWLSVPVSELLTLIILAAGERKNLNM